jgi:hypothetical protein
MKTIGAGLTFLLACGALCPQQYLISTFAGGAPPPTPAVALNTSIGGTISVAADASGMVYFGSYSLNCVFKIDPNGTLTRAAGTARAGYSGDGGPAPSAQLYFPAGLAVDGSGNLYIADSVNWRIRRVSPNGIHAQSLVATGGAPPYTWSLVAGTLPAGVALSSTGALTGTPLPAGLRFSAFKRPTPDRALPSRRSV